MIKGGYYIKPKVLQESIMTHAAPCSREMFDYFLKEANFTDSKSLKRGQLIKSYGQIQQDLSWRFGNTFKTYSLNQIKGAVSFLKKQDIIITEQVVRGILITICNYNMIQDHRNYESTPGSTEKRSGSTEKRPAGSTPGSTETELEDISKEKGLEVNCETGSTAGSPEKCLAIHNIHQNISIRENIYKRILPDPENGETEFERDRRIFFQAFPGVKTFQLFDDNADRKDKSLIKQFHLKDSMPVKYTQRLEELNCRGAGVYLCINETNGTGRKATDVVKVRAVYADCDECPIDPVWQYEPSMVVESSEAKYHAYWFTTDTPLDGFRQIQESIIYKFGSDPKVKDLPRVMRVPGFHHNKSTPFMSKIIHYTGQQFAFDYLKDLFPPPPRKKWSTPKYQTDTPMDGDFKGQYGASEGGRNNHVVARIGGMIKRNLDWSEIENEAFKEAAACSPPLPEHEVRLALKSMRSHAC